ncbi:uncharacterized protein LOC133333530 [Musca vetustissima]|uniref:uncharacterized protein LOC133333530 n=1 Tax=Musca vetustissima TaxID=27455 RepID=UPI002AB7B31F|nr:uncharacterized protein LOC133333530 [Musca vetustissima]
MCGLLSFTFEQILNQVVRVASGSPKMRELSHIRLIILLIVALNTLDFKMQLQDQEHLNKFQEDLDYCPQCFQSQKDTCKNLTEKLVTNSEQPSVWQNFITLLPQRSCKRSNRLYAVHGTQTRLLAKYFANSKDHFNFTLNERALKSKFLAAERLDGMQFYPLKRIDRFVDFLGTYHTNLPSLTIWLYLLVNIQPLFMPLLYSRDFLVPKTQGVCGFTIYQEYAGQDLWHYYRENFFLKLEIAKQLLLASVKFSHGFGDYRFYITDLTADNVVYSVPENRLSFVDLDTLFVVDSKAVKYKSSTHRHEYIECPGCFAYSPDDIASYFLSDLNIYSACQFLSEDLYRDKTKGFLYPIPDWVMEKYPELWKRLEHCVACPMENCSDRFGAVEKLLREIDKILKDNGNKS